MSKYTEKRSNRAIAISPSSKKVVASKKLAVIEAPEEQVKPSSEVVLALATQLALQAEQLADKALIVLQPVMTPECIQSGPMTYTIETPFPPLFESLRKQFIRISLALKAIEDGLDRSEI